MGSILLVLAAALLAFMWRGSAVVTNTELDLQARERETRQQPGQRANLRGGKKSSSILHEGVTPGSWREHVLGLGEYLNGGAVECRVGPSVPEGWVDLTLEGETPLEFPRDQRAVVLDGLVTFNVPPGSGRAWLEMPGVTRGRLAWVDASVGSVIPCTSYQPISDLVAVFGRVVDSDGSPAEAAGVEGCGTSAYADYETGEFMLFVAPGTCKLLATKQRNMGKNSGQAVDILAVAGQDVVDVVLVAPPVPEWRDSTEEESERVREEQCRYWVGKHSKMVALLKQIHAQQEPGSSGAEEFAKQLRAAEGRLEQSKGEYCGLN